MSMRDMAAVIGVGVLVVAVEVVVIRWLSREAAAKQDDEPLTLLGVVHPPGW